MGILEEKLTEAMDKKAKDITTFIWKGHKVLDENKQYVQLETRLIDMGEAELNKCYNHCKTMLFNKNTQNPGRYAVLKIITDQRDRCGVELFLRYLDQEQGISRFTLRGMIGEFLNNNKEVFADKEPLIKDVFSNVPNEYANIPLNLLMDGCLDKLGALNKKHLTRTFILRQGVWLSAAEGKELGEQTSAKEKLEVIRDRFNLKEVEKLFLNSRGLSYTEMRAMLNLKPNKKYMDLTTVQLETLRNRVLFSLEDVVYKHISSWEGRMKQISQVAEHLGVNLG